MPAIYESVAGTSYASRTNTAVSKPAGTVSGDELRMLFLLGATTAGGIPTPTFPAGWTTLSGPNSVADSSGFTVRSWVLRLRAGGSEGASYTVTHSVCNSDCVIVRVGGGADANGTVSTYASGTGTGDMTLDAVTTSAPDACVLALCHNWNLWGSGTAPADRSPIFTEVQDNSSSLIHVSAGTWAASGSTGTKTKDSDNGLAQDKWAGHLVAVESASAADPIHAATTTFSTSTSAAGSSVSATGLGFRPKLALVGWSGRTAVGQAEGDVKWGVGFVADSHYFPGVTGGFTIQSDAGPTSMATDSQLFNNQVVKLLTTTGAVDGSLNLLAMTDNSVAFSISDAFTASYLCHVLAIGGTDIEDVAVKEVTFTATTAGTDVTDIGFQPDAIFTFMASPVGALNSSSVNSQGSFGVATYAADGATVINRCLAGASIDGLGTSATASYLSTTDGSAAVHTTGGDQTTVRFGIDSFLSNGFRYVAPQKGPAGTVRILCLCVKGGLWRAGNFDTPTDSNAASVTGLGHTPDALVFASHDKAFSSAGTAQAHDERDIGFATGPAARSCFGFIDKDAAATADIGVCADTSAVLMGQNAATNIATDKALDLVSLDADGFTYIMDDPDAAAAGVWWVSVATSTPPTYTASGALTAGAATASGTATHAAPAYTASGALGAGAATATGSATFATAAYTASGTLTAGAATATGTASHTVPTYTGSGALAAGAASAAGTATFATVTYTASGALVAGAAVAAGSATFDAGTFAGSGALAAAPATAAGTATHTAPVYTAAGTLAAGAASAAGTATHTGATYTAAGAVSAGAATASGSATHTAPTYTGAGAVSAGPATAAGSALAAAAVYQGAGSVSAGAATASGAATFVPARVATGALTAGAATASGSAAFTAPTYAGAGTLNAAPATLAGSATHTPPAYTGAAAWTVGNATLAGSATFAPGTKTAQGALTVAAATLAGTATLDLSAVAVYYPGDWPTIRVRRQVRAVVAGYQDRTVPVPAQVRTIRDPAMGE
jgi:hypothetical protein